MTAAPLPRIPAPPHDPTSIVVGAGRFGWRSAELEGAILGAARGPLSLEPVSGARSLGEPSGSLAGLVPPFWVALEPGGGVLLLDRLAAVLRRWDECECRFVTVPCFGGAGSGPRQLLHPSAIAVAGTDLLVADTGNARVTWISLRGYVLRGHWRPPGADPWQPLAVAAEPRGTVLVGDRIAGGLQRFARDGRWLELIGGLGAVDRLAVDRCGLIHVGAAGEDALRVLSPDGREIERTSDPGALAGRFPPLPFTVHPDGTLDFGPPCGAFDAGGEPLGEVRPAPIRYAPTGRYVSEPLDSAIEGCSWHRVILRGHVPPGTSVVVWTHTGEVAAAVEDLELDDPRWATAQVARRVDGEWDCLVRGAPGRYLALQLELRSDGDATPRIDEAEIELPRVSLLRHLPAAFAEDPTGSEFPARFLSLFDTTLRSIERQVDDEAALLDARSAPADAPPGRPDMLGWLAGWIGVDLDRNWPEERRRRFLRGASRLGPRRGTAAGVRDAVLLFLGLDPAVPGSPQLILEHFRLRRWLFVGSGRVGEQAVLWGRRIANRSQLGENAQADESQLVSVPDPFRDPFRVLASRFSVFVPASRVCSLSDRRGLERLIASETPAHVQPHLVLVEPRMRIGVQSAIGLDAAVGRYPSGVTVDGTRLGRDGVLTGAGPAGGPSLRIGARSQIGSGTRLD